MSVGGARIVREAAGVAHPYKIESSRDGAIWNTTIDRTANISDTSNLSQPEHRFETKAVRYIRLTLTGYDDKGGQRNSDMRPWAGIREFEVFE